MYIMQASKQKRENTLEYVKMHYVYKHVLIYT